MFQIVWSQTSLWCQQSLFSSVTVLWKRSKSLKYALSLQTPCLWKCRGMATGIHHSGSGLGGSREGWNVRPAVCSLHHWQASGPVKKGWNPYHPWEWYIYLHENHKNQPHVGKYTIHGCYGKHSEVLLFFWGCADFEKQKLSWKKSDSFL